MTNSEGSIITGDSSPDELLSGSELTAEAKRLMGEFGLALAENQLFQHAMRERIPDYHLDGRASFPLSIPFGNNDDTSSFCYFYTYDEISSEKKMRISKFSLIESSDITWEEIEVAYFVSPDRILPGVIKWYHSQPGKGIEKYRDSRTAVEGVKGFLEELRKASQIPDL